MSAPTARVAAHATGNPDVTYLGRIRRPAACPTAAQTTIEAANRRRASSGQALIADQRCLAGNASREDCHAAAQASSAVIPKRHIALSRATRTTALKSSLVFRLTSLVSIEGGDAPAGQGATTGNTRCI